MPIDPSELRLIWPPSLFAAEAQALLEAGEVTNHAMGWLLAEAFHGDTGLQLFQQEHRGGRDWTSGPWALAGGDSPRTPAHKLIEDLIAGADQLPMYRPKAYYRSRQGPQSSWPAGRWHIGMVKSGFAGLVDELAGLGYFSRAFGSSCCDDAGDPVAEGQRQLSDLLSENQEDDDPRVQLWPPVLHGEDGWGEEWQGFRPWSDGLLFDVVEALHDLVARPRHRFWHDHCQEWDYADFTRAPGQAVYRWRVNQLFDRSNVPLRLAEDGQDVGLLVTSAGDSRDDLVHRVLKSAEPRVHDLVAHAVTQFRSRDATPIAKRSATKDLADVLELRRALLKRTLFSGDEDDLFQIANRFEIRHMSERQKSDYDPAFLDWIFWWYLGTIELTNTLLARQSESA